MKSLFLMIVVLMFFVFVPTMLAAQTDQASVVNPPISQPLIREGTFAVRLADALGVSKPANEAEAETALSVVGIAPRNGWIGDYPVTPDIVEELRIAVSEAADAGNLVMDRDAVLTTYQNVITEYELSVQADTTGQDYSGMAAPTYPDSTVITDYYYQEGPPVVTYYAPPVDYAYMYSWVPYPFWWWNSWFPGFFVLADFHVSGHGHGHGHGHGEHGEFVSNHFRDSGTGRVSRVDPAHRVGGGTFSDRAVRGWSSPSGQRGAQAIFNGSRTVSPGRSNAVVTSPSGNGRASVLPSRNRTYVSPSGRSGMVSGNTAVRTSTSGSYSGGSTFSQRSFGSQSGSSRSFSQPSVGSRSFHSSGGGAGSFSGAGRSSFGSASSFGGGVRGSFGGGGRR
jgi:hypothetical protein